MTRIDLIRNLCKKHKNIYDSIHGMISISKVAAMIIDHPIFQRLRHLKQLGACSYVFPNAVHTRFEHSLGTYYLCKKILNSIKINSSTIELTKPLINILNLQQYIKESDKIELDEYIIELISIGGLCHDIGHGPYSHMFDDIFIPEIIRKYPDIDFGENILHENRSTELLKIIISETEFKHIINNDEINFICDLINPNKDIHQGYIYQIVSNTLNGLDVDKFDYLTRDSTTLGINISFQADRLITNAKVINNIIVYPKQLTSDIINLFNTRHSMHRTVYGHKGVISIDYMLQELMLELDNYMNYKDLIIDLNKFINFTDYDVISHAKQYYYKDNKIKTILDKISCHQLYPLVFSKTIQKTDKEFLLDNFLTLPMLSDKDKYIIHQSNIGYISGNKKNPLDNIFLYSTKDDKIIKLLDSDLTKLIPENFQETVIMIFYKDKDEKVNEIKKELSELNNI
jgi:HD superfamily phosphohydrolase